jgi:hypothetical protein
MLRYRDGGGATWNSKEGHHWLMYFFHWLPGRTAALFVKIHRPEKCLPAAGLTLLRDNGIGLIRVNGVNLPIRSYVFNDAGAPLHVYYCYWDARSSYETVAAAEEEDWSPGGRVRAALRGRRAAPKALRVEVELSYRGGAAGMTELLSRNLGLDAVFGYRLDRSGALTRTMRLALPADTGPRHVAFGPEGAYTPLPTSSDRVLAFTRGGDVLVAIPRFPFAGLDDDATVEVPAGRWRSALVAAEVDGSAKVPFGTLRSTFPIAVLEHNP